MPLTEAKKEVFGDASPLPALMNRRMSGRECRKRGSSRLELLEKEGKETASYDAIPGTSSSY